MRGCPFRLGWLLPGGLLVVACVRPEALPPVPTPAAQATPPATPSPRPGTVSAITLTTFFPLQQSAGTLVYDVRPALFYHLGHIPGALSWPKGKFDSSLAVHTPELVAAAKAGQSVVLYCTDHDCPDAAAVARKLAVLGHSTAILEGGYADWKTAGLPLE